MSVDDVDQFIDKASDAIRRYWQRERPIELRPINLDHYLSDKKLEPKQDVWFRATGEIPDDAATQLAVLAYASDMTLLDTSLYAHGRAVFDPGLQVASLDHAMWFHQEFRSDEWLLFVVESTAAGASRGFNQSAEDSDANQKDKER